MRYLVTASEGFIGQHLCDALRRLGHEPTNLDIKSESNDAIIGYLMDAKEDDVVFLLGANADVSASAVDPAYDVRENVETTAAQMMACQRAGQVIFASTFGGFFSGAEYPVSETAPPKPTAPYFVGKLACEHYLRLIRKTNPWIAMRFANVYGPEGRGVVHDWLKTAADGRPLDVWGSWDATRDYVYVDDVIDALLRASHTKPQGPIHIGTGKLTSLLDLEHIMEDVCGVIDSVVEEPHVGYVEMGSCVDVALAEELLGWRATTNLKEGIWRTWQTYKQSS